MGDVKRGSWWLLAFAAFALLLTAVAAYNTGRRVGDGLAWGEILSGRTWKEALTLVTGPLAAVVAVVWWWKGEL